MRRSLLLLVVATSLRAAPLPLVAATPADVDGKAYDVVVVGQRTARR